MHNPTFWDQRYAREPWLGSGPGSRGVAAHYKAALLHRWVDAHRVRSIVDIGCGDLCWLTTTDAYPDWLQGVSYTGLDISAVIVQKNAARFPHCHFAVHDLVAHPPPVAAELVVCFDVLLHQLQRASFDAALGNVLRAIRGHALISYVNPQARTPVMPTLEQFDTRIEQEFQQHLRTARISQGLPSAGTNHFGYLPDLIAAMRPDLDVRVVGQYRFQEVYAVSPG